RISHHHFQQLSAVGPGDERTERGAEGQLDMGASWAIAVAAPHVALDHKDDMRAIMTVLAGDNARIPLGIEREILRVGREGETLFPDRRLGAILASDAAH